MELQVKLQRLINNIISPASKITDVVDIVSVAGEPGMLKTMVVRPDNTMVFLASIPCKCDESRTLSIPDCKNFLRLLNSCETDDTPVVTFNVERNNIHHKGKGIKFKYHLFEEDAHRTPASLKEEKIEALEYDCTFNTTKAQIAELVKFSSIVSDAEKVYFVPTPEGNVMAKIGDDAKSLVNEVELQISDQFEGSPIVNKFAIDVNNFLLLTFAEPDIEISMNYKHKLVRFANKHSKYIVFGLVK
jgi:hypothetical protein